MGKKTALAERLDEIRDRIAAAAVKARRQPSEITLVAVTKTAAPEQIREIAQLGVTDMGESRAQILVQRAAQINEFFSRRQGHGEAGVPVAPAALRWHMIGHLQRNKVKQILPLVHLIHSVDSLRLAEELDTQGAKAGRRIPILMELNASEEKSKFGVAVGAAIHLAEQIDSMPNVQLQGIMTMAPLTGNLDEARAVFARTHEVFEEMRWHKVGGSALKHLSMGMSNDFEQAIMEGSTMVRIGTALFGGSRQDNEAEEEG